MCVYECVLLYTCIIMLMVHCECSGWNVWPGLYRSRFLSRDKWMKWAAYLHMAVESQMVELLPAGLFVSFRVGTVQFCWDVKGLVLIWRFCAVRNYGRRQIVAVWEGARWDWDKRRDFLNLKASIACSGSVMESLTKYYVGSSGLTQKALSVHYAYIYF